MDSLACDFKQQDLNFKVATRLLFSSFRVSLGMHNGRLYYLVVLHHVPCTLRLFSLRLRITRSRFVRSDLAHGSRHLHNDRAIIRVLDNTQLHTAFRRLRIVPINSRPQSALSLSIL
jgi:hypothetical protein